MLVSEFHYDLPPELIAQHPPATRGASRMLTLSTLAPASSPTNSSPISRNCSRPAISSSSTTRACCPRASTPLAPACTRSTTRPNRAALSKSSSPNTSRTPKATTTGARWCAPPKKFNPVRHSTSQQSPASTPLLHATVLSTATSASAPSASLPHRTSSPSSSASATCRCRPTFTATSIEPDISRRPRALPDHLLAAVRLGRRAHRRPPFHPGDPRRAHSARRRDSRTSRCTSVSAPSSPCACRTHATFACTPSPTHSPPKRHAPSTRAYRANRRIIAVGTTTTRTLEHLARTFESAHGPLSADKSTRTSAALRQHKPLPLARARRRRRLQARPRSAHQLPPARVHAAHARQRLRRKGGRASRLRPRGRGALSLLQLWRLHAHHLALSASANDRETARSAHVQSRATACPAALYTSPPTAASLAAFPARRINPQRRQRLPARPDVHARRLHRNQQEGQIAQLVLPVQPSSPAAPTRSRNCFAVNRSSCCVSIATVCALSNR